MHYGTAGAGTRVARRSRTRPRKYRISAFVALGAAAVIALAACGGSSSTSSKKSTTTTSKGAAAAAAVVKTANSSTLGTIVVDSTGKTVYTLTNGGQQVACSGACLQIWPAVSLPAGTTNATGSGVQNVAAMGTQVTVNGAPVYTFSGDASAGSTNGEGITSFGGTWHVVKAGGGSSGGSTGGGSGSTGGGSGSTPATTSMGGSGY
jgi:predicted lipoprotein with Yx(FWY)xxD motif